MNIPSIRLDGNSRLTKGAHGWPTRFAREKTEQRQAIDAPLGGPLSLSALCDDGTPKAGSERLCLASPDGTMGSLRLPPWLAVSPGCAVYLLSDGRVMALGADGFKPIPLPRMIEAPQAIHATSDFYLVGRSEVLVLDADWRVVAHIDGQADILDSAIEGSCLLLLFEGKVLRLSPRAFAPEPLPPLPMGAVYRSVVALVDGGRAFLAQDGAAHVVDAGNNFLRSVTSASDLRALTPPPALRLDGEERFAVPRAMQSPCPTLAHAPPVEDPLAAARDGGTVFDRQGRIVEPLPRILATAPVFEKSGWWISERLDGGRDEQVWRTGRIALAALPPGFGVQLDAFTSDDPDALPKEARAEDGFFRTAFIHREQVQRASDRTDPAHLDFHIAARPGRYLWLRIALTGDGRRSPSLSSVTLTYGGARPLDLLPAEFRRQEPMRDHLERLLGLLETGTATARKVLDRKALLFDPRYTNGRMLRLIEDMLGFRPDPRLSEAVRRRLAWLQTQSRSAPGTRARLRERLTALVAAQNGLDATHISEWVRIIEGFETRDSVRLGQGGARLGQKAGQPLSAGIELGAERLDSHTDPTVADFQRSAYRVEVALPRALAPDDTAVDILLRAIADEVPAHIAVTLTRNRGGVRLAGDARLGIGTVLLDPQVIRLRGKTGKARLGIDAKLKPHGKPPNAVLLASHQGGSGRLL